MRHQVATRPDDPAWVRPRAVETLLHSRHRCRGLVGRVGGGGVVGVLARGRVRRHRNPGRATTRGRPAARRVAAKQRPAVVTRGPAGAGRRRTNAPSKRRGAGLSPGCEAASPPPGAGRGTAGSSGCVTGVLDYLRAAHSGIRPRDGPAGSYASGQAGDATRQIAGGIKWPSPCILRRPSIGRERWSRAGRPGRRCQRSGAEDAAACDTVTVWLPTVSVPDRAAPVLAAIV